MTDRRTRPGLRTTLADPGFRRLWLGALAANTGMWAQSTALGWLIYDLTRQAAWVGGLSFVMSIPSLVLGPAGGAIADRMDRRRVLWTSATVFVLGSSSLAALTGSGHIALWMVLVIAFLVGVANAAFGPTFQAVVPSLVPPERLQTAVMLNSMSWNLARIVGPGLAGLIVARSGEAWAFALAGACYLGLLVAAFGLDLPPAEPAAERHFLASIRAGFRYAARHREIRTLLLLASALALFGFPAITLLPAFAREALHLDATGFGALHGAIGSGAIASGLFLAGRAQVAPTPRSITMTSLIYGGLLVVLGRVQSQPAALVTLVAIGAVMLVVGAGVNTALQLATSEAMRGRVMSLLTVTIFGFPQLGALGFGRLADHVGISATYSVQGAGLVVAATIIGMATPEIRRQRA